MPVLAKVDFADFERFQSVKSMSIKHASASKTAMGYVTIVKAVAQHV